MSALPPGFTLDNPASTGLPPGFALDQQAFPHDQMVAQNVAEMGQGASGVAKQLGAYGLNMLQSIPFSDEAISGVGATFGGGQGQDFSQRYGNLQQRQQAFREAGLQTQPRIETPSYLPDITPTGVGQAGTMALMAPVTPGLGNSASLGGKVIQGMATGAGYGGLYGASNANSFSANPGSDRLSNALTGAATGAALGGAIPAIGGAVEGAGNIGKGISATAAEDLPELANIKKAAAGDILNQSRNVGAVFNDAKTQQIAVDVSKALDSKEFIPQLNPKTTAIVDHIKDMADNGNLDLNQLTQYRTLLGRVGNTEDGVSAGAVRRAISNAIDTAGPGDLVSGDMKAVDLLNKGRAAYQQASKFEDVSDVLAKANGDPNKIKAGLSRFAANDDNTRGWTLAEKSALKQAANTGVGENLLKAFGKFGFDFSKSGVGNTALPVLTMATQAVGNPIGVPLAFGATLARQGQKYLARGAAQNLLDVISK